MEIFSTDAAVWWEGHLAVDADGAPDAYGPNDSGLDFTADAGHDGDWFGVVKDANGDPVVQGPGDPCPGKFVASTSMGDHSKAETDPTRYVNASEVPYLSIPGNAPRDYGIRVGDVGMAYSRKTGQASAAIVADTGPRNKWGEGSIALTRALGLPSSPRNGGTDSGVVVVVFKGSSKGWPRSNEDVAQQVQDLVDAAGGFQQFLAPQS